MNVILPASPACFTAVTESPPPMIVVAPDWASASAIAIVLYNYFTSAIDGLTHAIDETSFSIIQNFTAQNK